LISGCASPSVDHTALNPLWSVIISPEPFIRPQGSCLKCKVFKPS
jgi:hypothetical protein